MTGMDVDRAFVLGNCMCDHDHPIAYEMECVEENVRDGQRALDGGSVLALHHRWIVPPERFPSERPGDGPQRHV